MRAELVGAAARSAHIAMREAWDALEHVLALMSDCEEEREMHYQGVIPCPYCGGPPMMCACVAREAGSLDDQRDAAVALVVQREAGERALHTAGREWALAGLVAVARPIASLPPSGVLVWGAGGGYRWDGRTPAPSGVRVGDTLSWLLCPLMADAVGLLGLYDPALVPRPRGTWPPRVLRAHGDLSWDHLVWLCREVWAARSTHAEAVAAMDGTAHWPAHLQEELVAGMEARLVELHGPRQPMWDPTLTSRLETLAHGLVLERERLDDEPEPPGRGGAPQEEVRHVGGAAALRGDESLRPPPPPPHDPPPELAPDEAARLLPPPLVDPAMPPPTSPPPPALYAAARVLQRMPLSEIARNGLHRAQALLGQIPRPCGPPADGGWVVCDFWAHVRRCWQLMAWARCGFRPGLIEEVYGPYGRLEVEDAATQLQEFISAMGQHAAELLQGALNRAAMAPGWADPRRWADPRPVTDPLVARFARASAAGARLSTDGMTWTWDGRSAPQLELQPGAPPIREDGGDMRGAVWLISLLLTDAAEWDAGLPPELAQRPALVGDPAAPDEGDVDWTYLCYLCRSALTAAGLSVGHLCDRARGPFVWPTAFCEATLMGMEAEWVRTHGTRASGAATLPQRVCALASRALRERAAADAAREAQLRAVAETAAVMDVDAGMDDDGCAVCGEAFGDAGAAVPWGDCGHTFHLACLSRLFRAASLSRCPSCRADASPELRAAVAAGAPAPADAPAANTAFAPAAAAPAAAAPDATGPAAVAPPAALAVPAAAAPAAPPRAPRGRAGRGAGRGRGRGAAAAAGADAGAGGGGGEADGAGGAGGVGGHGVAAAGAGGVAAGWHDHARRALACARDAAAFLQEAATRAPSEQPDLPGGAPAWPWVPGVVDPDGGWDAIDRVSVATLLHSPFSRLDDVPRVYREQWARATADVLEYVVAALRDGDVTRLDRGLKWYLCYHDMLLRGRGVRGGKRTEHLTEIRFRAWREGRREDMVVHYLREREQAIARRRGGSESSEAADEHPDARAERILPRVLAMIADGEVGRAVRLMHSSGVARVTPGVVEQLQRKHPERRTPLPAVLTGAFSRATVTLTETFRSLRRHRGTGPTGRRNEYLSALVGHFDDPHAASVMERYDAFATALVNAELPAWFYLVLGSSRLVPLVKAPPERPGADPDVRPVAVGETDLCAITRTLWSSAEESLAAYLSPQQVAVGVPGGLSILVHGVRELLTHRPDFVVVRLDLANAYNTIDRAVVLARLASVPELAYLAPAFHALHAPAAQLVLPNGERLFGGDRGDSAEGVRQGSAEASAAFCVGIHPELSALDSDLRAAGGGAWADMDDVYAVGPADCVFDAVDRFATAVLQLGLDMRRPKLSAFSPAHDLEMCPRCAAAGVPVGYLVREEGFWVADVGERLPSTRRARASPCAGVCVGSSSVVSPWARTSLYASGLHGRATTWSPSYAPRPPSYVTTASTSGRSCASPARRALTTGCSTSPRASPPTLPSL